MNHREFILNGGNLNAKGVKAFVQIPIESDIAPRFFSSFSEKVELKREMLELMVNQPNISKIRAKKLPLMYL